MDDSVAARSYYDPVNVVMSELRVRAEEKTRRKASRYSVYLLYWCKSTNAAAAAVRACRREDAPQGAQQVLSLLALLVQKYRY